MARADDQNIRSGSTTYEWKKVKIAGSARTGQHGGRKPGRFSGLSRRNRTARLTMTISYKGGAESWWLIETRGRHAVFPGHRCLDDVMAEINREFEPPR